MRLLRVPAGSAIRLIRGYAASATKPEPEAEPQAESSAAAQRRLWPAPPAPQPPKSASASKVNNSSQDSSRGSIKPKRNRSPKALALLRAQKLARALSESEPPSTSTITTPPTFHQQQQLQLRQSIPTVEDLEAKRPPDGPPPLLSRRYSKRYKRLHEEIDNAFVAKQLLKLATQIGVRVPRGRGKGVAIKGILESWGWEPPVDLDDLRKREQAVGADVEKDWGMSNAELYLIMRDTDSLRPIMEQGVRFSIPTLTGLSTGTTDASLEPLAEDRILRGTGTQASLAEFDQFIIERRTAIATHSRDVAYVDRTNTESALFRAIANSTGVYIERKTLEHVYISGLSPESVSKAEILLHQAAQHSLAQTTERSISVPSSEVELALYPHIPAPTGSTPWQDTGIASKPMFRLRGVQPWELKVGHRETTHVDEDLEHAVSTALGEEEGLSTSLGSLDLLAHADGNRVVARFGHLVYADTRPEGLILSPPSSGKFTFQEWAKEDKMNGTIPVFLPTLSPSLVHFPLETRSSRSQRLTYRAEDGHLLEITCPVEQKQPGEQVTVKEPVVESGWHQELDAMLERLDVESESESEGMNEAEQETASPTSTSELLPVISIRVFSEKSRNVAMPDRPVDLSLTSRSSERSISLDENIESPFQTAIEFLRDPKASLPPSTIEMEGQKWQLLSALELDITETPSTPTNNVAESDETPSFTQGKTTIRTVTSTDLVFGMNRTIRYAELESQGPVTSDFWKELARCSRVLPPGAGAMRSEIF